MARLFAALLGAGVVTVLLLLAMNEVVSEFRERDGTRYFLVDFIQAVPTGRQRVQRLEIPDAATERPSADLEPIDPNVAIDRPVIDDAIVPPGPTTAPELDPSAVERDAR